LTYFLQTSSENSVRILSFSHTCYKPRPTPLL
jgi:hypothetical protein